MSAANYTVTFVNNSSITATACLYQVVDGSNMTSLAWLCRPCASGTRFQFTWTATYNFVWGPPTSTPGGVFFASQTLSADPAGNNHVTLGCSGGAFSFSAPDPGPEPGSLFTTEDGTIPLNQASVGIGMFGAPTLITPAVPNWSLQIGAQPTYWIVFGDYTAGQTLDLAVIPGPRPPPPPGTSAAAQIAFPPRVFAMTATLSAANTWSIAPTRTSIRSRS